MYALIKDGKVAEYPYNVRQYRTDNPNVSVPAEPTPSQLEELGIYTIATTARPLNQTGKIVTEETPRLFNGIWTQVWSVRNASPLELQEQHNQLVQTITVATQERLDRFAATRGYDNVNSSAKYKDITDEEIASLPAPQQALVTKFRAESRYLALATASTWAKLFVILDEVQAGTYPVPSSAADIEPDLPILSWPV